MQKHFLFRAQLECCALFFILSIGFGGAFLLFIVMIRTNLYSSWFNQHALFIGKNK